MTRLVTLLLAVLLPLGASAHDRWQIVRATAQTTDATSATPTAVAGLSFPVLASQNYMMRCYVVNTSADATTGIRLSVTGPAAPTAVTFDLITHTSTTAAVQESFQAFTFVSSVSSSIVTVTQLTYINMMLRNGANAGTVQVTINPEANTSVTAEIGSWCEYSSQYP